MTATKDILNGGDITVFIDGTAVAYSTGASLSITHSPREAANKTDGRWMRRLSGRLDWSGSCPYLAAFTDADGNAIFNIKELFAKVIASTRVLIKFSNENTGDSAFTGYAQLTGQNIDFPDQANVTGDISFSADGEIQLVAIT